jgi:hypothetical protein
VNASPAFQSTIASQPEPSPAVAKFLKRAPRLLIGGEWVESKSGSRVPVVDPATGKEIAQVADANAADVDRAVAAARAAFEKGPWAEMLPAEREALLWKLSDLVARHADELAVRRIQAVRLWLRARPFRDRDVNRDQVGLQAV